MLFKGLENKDSCEAANQDPTQLSLLAWTLLFLSKGLGLLEQQSCLFIYLLLLLKLFYFLASQC